MNTPYPSAKTPKAYKPNSTRSKTANTKGRGKSSIWDRGIGGGRSGTGKSTRWSAGAFAGSSWAGKAGAGLLCAVLLGACSNIPDFKDYSAYNPVPEKTPKVQAVAVAHTVTFVGNGVTLDKTAGSSIDAFLARQRVDRTDALEVAIPASGGELARGRAERVLAYLNLKRLPAGLVVDDDPKLRADAVRVVVHRYQVTLPGCPDWTDKGGITHSNAVHSNWGCANAVNLGLMVADPGDLVRGRHEGLGDGAAQALGIQRYRAGETKPLLGASTSEAPAEGTGSPTAGGEGGGMGQ